MSPETGPDTDSGANAAGVEVFDIPPAPRAAPPVVPQTPAAFGAPEPDPETVLRFYSVGVVKIPHAQRDVIRRVLPHDQAVADRGFATHLGGDTADRDRDWPVGSHVAYSLWLTDTEAARLAQGENSGPGNNVRYVELEPERWHMGDPPRTGRIRADRVPMGVGEVL